MNEITELCAELGCEFTYTFWPPQVWPHLLAHHRWLISGKVPNELNNGMTTSFATCLAECKAWVELIKTRRQE
jgi:hypothetical protein